jgi:glycerophosphoryl diester phosphodiesterase
MIRVHGHRGARAVLPENTIPGFQYAISLGVDAIEFDVVVTKDDVVVVSHDSKMNRKICTGPARPVGIRKMTFNELRRWDCGAVSNPEFPMQKSVPGTRVPALSEVLELAALGNFEFHIEAKSVSNLPADTFAQLILERIRAHKLRSRAVLLSFDYSILHAMRQLDPAIRLCALYEGRGRKYTSLAEEAGASIVSPHYRSVTSQKVAEAHGAGLQVVAWTANRPEEWDRLIEANVDAIVTDDPAQLIEYLKIPTSFSSRARGR